jgi:hypothetical protein
MALLIVQVLSSNYSAARALHRGHQQCLCVFVLQHNTDSLIISSASPKLLAYYSRFERPGFEPWSSDWQLWQDKCAQ